MGRENVDNWSVRKCADVCLKCQQAFVDRQTLASRLSFDEGEYVREDFCEACWDKSDQGLSTWKTLFIVPPPPREEAVKKENAESLLRKLISKEDEADLNAVFILMVMLERKKVFVERAARTAEDGRKVRIYEHRKTGESFTVVDPGLKLDELEHVQEEVVCLLGGKPRNAPPEPEDSPDADADEPAAV